MKLLVIQNSQIAPLGVLGDCLRDRNVQTEIVAPFKGDSLPEQIQLYSGLIVLGGPMNAEDDENYPYLSKVVRLIQLFSAAHQPILGICLGAQLIARAFGQRVYPHSTVELGFTPLRSIQAAIVDDPLLQIWSDREPIHLMEWHFDTFDLPTQATLLMTGDRCQHQAYRIHNNIYGFQCHIEVTRAILQDWVVFGNEYLQRHYPNFPEDLAQQIDAYFTQSEKFCRIVGNAWIDLLERQPLEQQGSNCNALS
ncbi:MAG TPA: type 1 glutamine amidotransferase [Leptolyngbyaceae cyanobacterium M33_DOE_097]|uniref:Type 1 glutamine amidotransferase n=1 Tax=Oscillatoriales cyanobacterium SpSt-418 TaxID=2282169 RepID=A0A7C3KC25_9CYAN|nr:type 1 glutamine amidotransferase [Leptolyngbyaceae cyanobacterium M33_DOE_097]